MTHLIDQVGGWIEELILAIGYPGIVLVMAVENVFPPIPSEAVLPFAGALAAKGEMNFWGAVAAGTAGSVLGAVVLYGVGYVAHEAGVRRLVAAYGRYVFISEHDLDRGAEWFRRHGEAVIFFGTAHPHHSKHRLRSGGLHADESGALPAVHHAGHCALEPAADLCGLGARRELGDHSRVYAAV